MKIIINDEFTHKMSEMEIDEKTILPRIGEGIYLGYNPSSQVTNVTHDYEHEIIFVTCNGSKS